MRPASRYLAFFLIANIPDVAFAQLAEKPSLRVAQRQGHALAPGANADQGTIALGSIGDLQQFSSIARTYNLGSSHAITHTLFVVDRKAANQVYFLNVNRFPFHEDFLRAQLLPGLDQFTLNTFYINPDRRFIMGTVGWYAELQRWVFEFWEGDRLTPELLSTAQKALAANFFAPLTYKANSTRQEAVGEKLGIETLTETQILGQRQYNALNIGTATGRLRLVSNIEDESEDDIEASDIVVLKEVPLSLPPVAGVINTHPSTVLSHVNVLAKGWGIPNIYVHEAFETLAQYDRKWIKLEAQAEGYAITPAQQPTLTKPPQKPKAPRAARLDVSALQTLAEMRKSASAYCGSKAATLGEIEYQRVRGKLPDIASVPDGFCIPYVHYAHFMARPDVRARIKAALASEGFDRSRVVRRQALQALRNDLAAMPPDGNASALWGAQWKTQLAGGGVFVRSSSNSEDLPNWSGAGLFSTVPNVRTEQDLLRAVQTVWASVYNFEAYEVRRHAGFADSDLLMGVFVMRAVDAAASGVMITRDPFDLSHRNSAYISAKNGLGIKVVEGKKLAEQSLYDLRSNAVRRLSWSDEDSLLVLDAKGGVVEQAVAPGAKVLTDNEVRDLAKAGLRLKQLFGGVDQDIEWAIDKSGRIVLLQSRPYIDHSAR